MTSGEGEGETIVGAARDSQAGSFAREAEGENAQRICLAPGVSE